MAHRCTDISNACVPLCYLWTKDYYCTFKEEGKNRENRSDSCSGELKWRRAGIGCRLWKHVNLRFQENGHIPVPGKLHYKLPIYKWRVQDFERGEANLGRGVVHIWLYQLESIVVVALYKTVQWRVETKLSNSAQDPCSPYFDSELRLEIL